MHIRGDFEQNANRKKGNANRNPSTFRMFSPLYFAASDISVNHFYAIRRF